MPIPEHLKVFIFECVDSVEALELLLALWQDPERRWTAEGLNEELRLNLNSVNNRLRRLHHCGLLARDGDGYVYRASTERQARLVNELFGFYRTHRHRVLEAIFSPLKKVHDFAQAFRVRSHRSRGDDNDG